MHKKNIESIIRSGSGEQMEALRDLFIRTVDEMDEEKKAELEYCIHKIANGGKLGEAVARHWVSEMKNKDGTSGEHWTKEQTDGLHRQVAPSTDAWDFYATMNMMYSDYCRPEFNSSDYAMMAKDWLCDEDVGSCKTVRYYYFVVR